MREWPDFSKLASSSPSVTSMSTASMSARGTMTSSTLTSRRRRILAIMARSSGEKPAAASVASASARSSRTEAEGLRPTTAFSRSIQLSGERSPLSAAAVSGSGCGSSAWLPAGSVFVICSSLAAVAVRLRVGETNKSQYSRFKTLHYDRFRFGIVAVAKEMKESMHDKMGKVILERQPLIACFAFHRLPRENDVAEERTEIGPGSCGREGEDVGCFV